MTGIFRAFVLASRWVWAQIQRFPVPIEEVVYANAFAPAVIAQRIARRPAVHVVRFRRF